MGTKKDTDLAKKEQNALATAMDFSQFGGTGFEDTGKDDYAIPFLNIIQANSPQVDEAKADFDAEAKKGEIFNSVTGERFDGKTGIIFQPVFREHNFIEYVPRDNGGGFVGVHAIDSDIVAKAKAESTEFGKYKTPAYDKEGKATGGMNELVETFSVYGNLLDETGEEFICQAIISFTSTKIKVYKKMMTSLNTFMLPTPDGGKAQVPMFANRLRITTGTQVNKGQTSYNFHVAPMNGSLKESVLAPDSALIRLGYEFHNLVKDGAVNVDRSQAQEPSGPARDDAPF